MSEDQKPKSRRGFAGMSLEKRRAIAAMGGASVPPEKRTYSVNRDLAQEAGRVGGSRGKKAPEGEG